MISAVNWGSNERLINTTYYLLTLDIIQKNQFFFSNAVPGDGGSQFEARINKPAVVHVWCSKKSDWFSLWLNVEQLAPYVADCFVDNMR